jgi:hypothetical protein
MTEKTQQVNQQIDEVADVMRSNLQIIIDRGDNLETLQKNTVELSLHANTFKKGSQKARRRMACQVIL